MSKNWKIIGTIMAATAAAAGAGYYYLFRRPLPQTDGVTRLHGLHQPVTVYRDAWGIPHIYAENMEDLFFAQGYIHAQDRLWQMDFFRRLVAGRVSEILGARSIELDRWVRTLSMRHTAEQEVGMLSDETHSLLAAYAAGVTSRISRGRLPVEFKLLSYRPEPWQVADSVAWGKMMAWNLSVNWETELLRAQLIAHLGPEKAAELEPGQFERWPTVLPAGTDYSHLGQAALDKAEYARRWLGPSPHAGLGSNNWAVSPDKTVSGHAIFANDMHLGMNLPGIWYENHLSAPDYHVTGVTFAGQPGIVSGHNGFVSWGYTNGFSDVQDLYLEDLRPTNQGGYEYRFKDDWLEAEVREETIFVKGEAPVVEAVITTHHGPIVNKIFAAEAAQKPFDDQPLALQWTALDPNPSMQETLVQMNSVKSCAEMYETLKGWSVPTQNVVYADIHGNIAHTHAGRIPVRDGEPTLVPALGWTGEHEWIGFIPYHELPHQMNPEQGFIGTANNAVTGQDYPYFVSQDFSTGDRAQRIIDWLTGPEKVDLITMQQMQYDTVSETALVVAGHLAALPTADPLVGMLLAEMVSWDGDLRTDSRQAVVYKVFMAEMQRLVLAPRVQHLLSRVMGEGPNPVLASDTLFSARVREWMENLLLQPDSDWFDLGNGETRADCMRRAMNQTVDFLQRELGADPAGWHWGALHKLHFAHTLGGQPPLDLIFNKGPYPYPGDATTLHASGGSSHDLRLTKRIAAPFRFMIDMGNVNRAWGQLAPGQSGHPASPHFADQIRDHLTGFYHPMWFASEDVEANAVHVLQLLPH